MNVGSDLNGAASDINQAALLLIDVINPLEFPEADQLLPFLGPMAANLREIKARCKDDGIPVIYANDNFGKWRSDLRAILDHCRKPGCKGNAFSKALEPDMDDYFVLKPRHSAFYSTTLDILLRHLGVRTLILGGIAADICVFFSANDAYMRDYRVIVPADCVASNTQEENDSALSRMRKAVKADTRPFREWGSKFAEVKQAKSP